MRRLLSVVLGSSSASSRATESQKLLNWGYTNFELVTVAKPDAAVTSQRVWKGQTKLAPLGVAGGLSVAVPTGMGGKIDIKVNVPDRLIAPLSAGQVVGDVTVALPDGTILTKQPLVVAQPVEADGFLGRMWDTLLLLTE